MSKSLKQFLLSLFVCGALLQVGMRCAKAEPPYELTLEDEFGKTLPSFRTVAIAWRASFPRPKAIEVLADSIRLCSVARPQALGTAEPA